jgi:hypothetical protein
MDSFRQQELDLKSKQQELKISFEKKSKEIKNIQSRTDNKLFLFGDKVTKNNSIFLFIIEVELLI